MTGADVDGCDLVLEERSVRVAWPAPVSTPAEVRTALIRLARAARAGQDPGRSSQVAT
jgi:putative heme iron utilization protein